jgi:sulfur carrier protein ThiS
MSKTPKKEENELVVIKSKVSGMQKMLDNCPVTNDEQLKIASDRVKDVKLLAKFITEKKEKYTAPAKAIIAEAREQYDPYIKECQNAELILKDRAKKYMLEVENKRIEQENKIAARVESGTMKVETAMKKIEALPEAQKTVRSDTGSALRLNKRKVAVIENPELVPKEYWVIDDVRVRRDALERDKKGLPQIPGVIITEEANLSGL